MKTCTFRGAQPRKFKRNVNEGDAFGGGNGEQQEEVESILCQAQPTARYGMSFCYQSECFLCESKQRRFDGMLRRRQREEEENNRTAPITGVHFTTQQMHRFVNKYEAILNCPAVSVTTDNREAVDSWLLRVGEKKKVISCRFLVICRIA